MTQPHAMISFYAESSVANRDFLPTTAPQVINKLERMFRSMEELFHVRLTDNKIIGLDSKTLQMWFNQVSGKWKPATINNYVCTLNPFLRWAYETGEMEGDVLNRYLNYDFSHVLHTVPIPSPDELPEEERPKDKYYTHEQTNELLWGNNGYNRVRDRAIMALVLYSGLRVSELCSLTIGQFRHTKGSIRLRRKGGAWANAAVGEAAYPLVEAYLATREDADDPSRPLFITTHGKPCSRTQLYKAISNKQKALGIATGPHALRHTSISEVANKFGAPIARDFANHKSMKITNRYAHTTEEQRLVAANGLHW